jgi:hypothetical protein
MVDLGMIQKLRPALFPDRPRNTGLNPATSGDGFSLLTSALIHRSGRGVRKDGVKAYRWLNLSAEQGTQWAIVTLRELETDRVVRREYIPRNH